MSLRLMGRGQNELKVLYWLITATLVAILLYPLGCVLFQSVLTPMGATGFDNYTALLDQPRFWRAMGNSFIVSGISAAIAAVLGFFCAYGLHFTRINPTLKKIIQIVVLLPLFLPTVLPSFIRSDDWDLSVNSSGNRRFRFTVFVGC